MVNFIRHFFLFAVLISLQFGCATTEITPQSRIPNTRNQSPRYETSEDLKNKITKLQNALISDPDNTGILLQLSSLYLEIGEEDQAIFHMEKLKSLDFREDPRLYGSLASLYKKKEKYKEALMNFEIFKSLLPENSSTRIKIDKEINQLNFIIKSLESSYQINLRPLTIDINTENSEYLPQFTMDDSTIIFTRRYFNQEDLFVGKKIASGYQVNAIEEINTLSNEGAHTISADGNLLIFTQCDKKSGYGSCDLYVSRKNDQGKWNKPSNMGATVNAIQWDSQPSLSADGRTLYFTSKRPGGIGGSDIWFSKLQPDNKWSMPVNLGSSVNTPMDDESPFIHADGKTLYFRSKGYDGLGNFDLYKTTKKSTGWTKPINLGSPINTTGEDGALVVSLDGTRGYYATDVFNKIKLNNLDLFEFDLPEPFRPDPMTFVRGRVLDENAHFPLKAEITITSLDGSSTSTYYKSNSNGEFLAAIPIGSPSLINISADSYIFYSDHIAFEEVKYSVDPYNIQISLAKIVPIDKEEKMSKPVILKNIFFESGSARLLAISENEIDILYNLLKSKPDIRMEILGHTDNVGSTTDNLKLSLDRAKAVKLSLVNKGISPERLTALGKGEEQPVDTNNTEEGRSNNRRTEFIIIN